MITPDAKDALMALPYRQRIELATGIIKAHVRTTMAGLSWNPTDGRPTANDEVTHRARQNEQAKELAELAVGILRSLAPLVENRTLAPENFRPPLFPRSIIDASRGTKSSEHGHQPVSEAWATAAMLYDIILAWRGTPKSGVGEKYAEMLVLHGDEPQKSTFKNLAEESKLLPEFTTGTALVWWKKVGIQLLIQVAPRMAPRQQGKRLRKSEGVDSTINTHRKQIKERFLDLAPGPDKSRNY